MATYRMGGDKKLAPLSDNRSDEKSRKKLLQQSEDEEILGKLRETVKRQLNLLQSHALNGIFTGAEASVVHKMAQTYQILINREDKTEESYDFSDLTDEEMEKIQRDREVG